RTFHVSSKFNIFHVVFDSFQTDVFLEILDDKPFYKKSFEGFTIFADNAASYIWTSMAYPLIFSSQDHTKYEVDRIYGGRPFLKELFEDGWKLNITFDWSDSWYDGDIKLNGYNSIWRKMNPKAKGECIYSILGVKILKEAPVLLDLSLFRSFPSVLKKTIYNDGKWFFQEHLSNIYVNWFAYAYHSKELFNEYLNNLTVTTDEPTYNLIHLNIPHRPFVLDENCAYQPMDKPEWWDFSREKYYKQAHCAVRLMLDFLEKLRELDIYKSSVILFQSDTGAGIDIEMKNLPEDDSDSFVDKIRHYSIKQLAAYATPLLAVKKANETKPLEVSFAPVNQVDTRCSVLRFAGIDVCEDNEKTFFSLGESESRARIFVTNSWETRTSGNINRYHKFEIIGRVADFKSWIDRGVIFKPNHYSVVSVENATSQYTWNREGWGRVGGPYPERNIDKRVVWIFGPRAVIEFYYPEGSEKLRLNVRGRPIYDNLKILVKVNNKTVGEHTFLDRRRWENVEISFEALRGVNRIEIESSKWLEDAKLDPRPLSVLLETISIR
ncbi:MAG: sulfatase-like hydrolase/transferase, partial [Candidatus Hodarchaeota archaeon]